MPSFAIAAGHDYAAFNSTQCTVDFIPTKFSVTVNHTDFTTNVTSSEDPIVGQEVEDIEPTKSLINITMHMPTSFSQQHACDLYTSLVGNTFESNIQSIIPAFNSRVPSTITMNRSETLRGVEDTFTSMLDNSLLALSTAQLMVAHDTQSVNATVSLSAVRIGKSVYVYIPAGINLTILLIYLMESVRTQAWRGLTRLDYTNIKEVVVSTSKGGSMVADEARRHQEGEADSADVGKIRVRLEGRGAGIKLVRIDGNNDDDAKGTRRWFRMGNKGSEQDTELRALTQDDPP